MVLYRLNKNTKTPFFRLFNRSQYHSRLASVCGFEQGYVDCLIGKFHGQQLVMKLRNTNTLGALHHQNKPDWFRDLIVGCLFGLLLKTSTVVIYSSVVLG